MTEYDVIIIGAGSVVTKDVIKGTVVVGNPAVAINKTSKLPYKKVPSA